VYSRNGCKKDEIFQQVSPVHALRALTNLLGGRESKKKTENSKITATTTATN